jgi:D-3-phosphoglycerate dehydrogenase / 2-oxoglutarate reductase
MKVLVADKFEKSGLEGLRRLGCEVLSEPDLKDDALTQRLRESEATILVVRSTKVTREMLEASKLGVVIRAGAGYNTIDVAAASERGILVTNCPGKNSQAVAELAFGLLIACDRHIPDNVIQLREGKWNKKGFSKASGLYGRTLGLVGMGKIGQEMVSRAKAFGMNVIAYSRWMTPEIAVAMGIGRAKSAEELAAQSDFVSVHVSLTPESRGSIGKSFFDAMKPGAVFVNTSRAEVVDQAALEAATAEKGIIAGLDVFDGEPAGGEGAYEGSLKSNPNVYVTHHIGASTDQAQEAVADETVRIVREYMFTGAAPNVVNVKKAENATHVLVVRHLDKVGVLAHVLGVLKEESLNVQEMENIVLSGAKSAIAQISVDGEPSDGALGKLKGDPDVFDASAFAIQK